MDQEILNKYTGTPADFSSVIPGMMSVVAIDNDDKSNYSQYGS